MICLPVRTAIRAATRAGHPALRSLSTASPSSSSPTNTISPDEIAHFSALSAHWWDPTGEFALLHRMNPARVKFMRESILREEELEGARWLQGKDVLDVGCGGGIFAEVSSLYSNGSERADGRVHSHRPSPGSAPTLSQSTHLPPTSPLHKPTPLSTLPSPSPPPPSRLAPPHYHQQQETHSSTDIAPLKTLSLKASNSTSSAQWKSSNTSKTLAAFSTVSASSQRCVYVPLPSLQA
jgi:hypothetical protein